MSSYLRRPSEADFLSPLDCTILCNWRENNQLRKCHLNMPHSTTQHSTVQHKTIQHTTPHQTTIQYNTIQYNTIQYIQYNTSQHSTTQHSTTPYNATQQNTTQKEQQLTNINRRKFFHSASNLVLSLLLNFVYPRSSHFIHFLSQFYSGFSTPSFSSHLFVYSLSHILPPHLVASFNAFTSRVLWWWR